MATSAFDRLCSSLRVPMVVVTAVSGTSRAGCLVGFHGQTSIDPPRYTVHLSRANHTYRVALGATHLMVHFLDPDQHELARHFGELTGDEVDKLRGIEHRRGPDGRTPRLAAVRTWLFGEIRDHHDGDGDHVGFVLRPEHVECDPGFRPLDLDRTRDLHAGHRPGTPA